jgi:Ca-activated chloride channel family protein
MAGKIERSKAAVWQFLKTSNPQDEFFLITFADAPRLASDFTTRPENIEAELVHTLPKGRTSLLDAIYMGLQKMREAHYGRKALLIVSDGGDNHSRYTESEVKSAIKEGDVMVYAVGTYDRHFQTMEEMLGPELLQNMAELTGGQAFAITNPNDLPMITRNIGSQLRHQYVLGYRPEAGPDGKWRKIRVKLSLSKQLPFLHVRARAGYYAGAE